MSTSFCWHCGKGYPPNASDELAAFVIDPLGNRHRVHQVCFEDAYATVMQPSAKWERNVSDLIPWLQNRVEDMRRANATPNWAARLDEAAAELTRQASEINKLTQQRDEHFSAVERLTAENAALRAAFNAARAFIYCHVADPDITPKMRETYAEFDRHCRSIESDRAKESSNG